jgi:formylmethanofuran dehydrogenase subunit E
MSTGCTTGKHNLDVEERDGVAAEFTTKEKTVLITVKKKVLEEIELLLRHYLIILFSYYIDSLNPVTIKINKGANYNKIKD